MPDCRRSSADTINVGDLNGTDLTALTADLSASLGGSDGVTDQVAVNGTAGADAVSVVGDGSSVVVQGLPAAVRVTGADPTLDHLAVNGGAGDDTITATPAAAALILLDLIS